tara:strand:- start:76 stop:1044 length:969 start_codon:yes stop_codon:yes gene_type:complete
VKKLVTIIIGGTGQFGITTAKQLISKKYKVIISTRSLKKHKNLIKLNNKIKFCKLNIYNKKEIKKIIKKYDPNYIFYFAGQSSPKKSFSKKQETFKSNVIGCKNILEVINKEKKDCKFLNAASSEMYGKIRGKIKLSSPKKPINPYGSAKVKSFNITKMFRLKNNLKTYNAIIFNTESYLRNKKYLIPKICLAAINAKFYGTKTAFGNINVSREWNWCEEQSKYLIEFLKKKPQDFILSNGKNYTAKKMIKFAFDYFNIDYRNFIFEKKKYFRDREVITKSSNFKVCLKRNNIKRKTKIFGQKLIKLMILYYLNEKKHGANK